MSEDYTYPPVQSVIIRRDELVDLQRKLTAAYQENDALVALNNETDDKLAAALQRTAELEGALATAHINLGEAQEQAAAANERADELEAENAALRVGIAGIEVRRS